MRLVGIAILLAIVLPVLGQSCQIYDITNNAFCLVRTDYPVFVAPGSSQNEIGDILLRALNISEGSFGRSGGALERASAQLPPACLASYTALICTLFIPGCNSSGSKTQPIASPLCLSSCTDVERDCGPAISQILGINCSATVPGTNTPLFLNDSDIQVYSNVNGSWNLQCVRANQYPYCQVTILTNQTATAGFCKLRCNNSLWSAPKAAAMRRLIYAFGWLSFLANLFVVLSYLLDPQKRSYPVILALFFSLNYLAWGLVIAIHSIVQGGSSKVLCKDEANPHTQSYFLCGLGGVVSHFSIVSGACWMLMLALNLVYFMKFSKHLPKWSQIPMHAFSWGFPAILVAVALAKKSYSGAEPSLVTCGLKDTKLYDGLLLVPYFTLFALAIILALGVVIYVTKRTGRKGLLRQSQLLGFLVLLSLMEMLAIILRIHQMKYKSSTYIPKFIHWTACEYAKYLGYPNQKCSRPAANEIAYVAFASLVQLVGQLLVFVFFGVTRQNLQFWKRVIQNRSWDIITDTSSSTKSGSRPPSVGTSESSLQDSMY